MRTQHTGNLRLPENVACGNRARRRGRVERALFFYLPERMYPATMVYVKSGIFAVLER